MAHFYLNKRRRIFETCTTILVLNFVLISCDEKVAVFQVAGDKLCDTQQLKLKPNEVFRVIIYSENDLFNVTSRTKSNRPVTHMEKFECGKRNMVLDKINSSYLQQHDTLTYDVSIPNVGTKICNVEVTLLGAEDSRARTFYFWLCIALGLLFVFVFGVETALIFYYKKKYKCKMLHEDGLKDNQIKSEVKSDRRRYSSPPENRRAVNKNKDSSDIYEVLEMHSEESEPESPPPAKHSTLSKSRPRLRTPCLELPPKRPIPKKNTWNTQPRVTTLGTNPQDDYEEMDQDLVLTSKMSAQAPELNVGQPASSIISELNKKLAKKKGPPAPPKKSRSRMRNDTREKGEPRVRLQMQRQHPANGLSDKVPPPVPKTPRPKRENLVGATLERPRPHTSGAGTTHDSDSNSLSSGAEWENYDELQNYHIYNNS